MFRRSGTPRRGRIAAKAKERWHRGDIGRPLPSRQLGNRTFDKLFRAAPQIPILVLISADHEALAELAVQHGAQDFLLKERLDNYLLPKALRNMVERAMNVDALFEEKERAQVTLNSIGDAVMSTDEWCNVTYLNVVAERLTGWAHAEAAGHPVAEVFHIVDANTREAVENPICRAHPQSPRPGDRRGHGVSRREFGAGP